MRGSSATRGLPWAALLLTTLLPPAARADGPADSTTPEVPRFLGTPDDEILRRLCEQPIASLELNKRGTTIKFSVKLVDGTRGSLRPAQSSEAGNPRAEVAAYRLSRVLGLGKVAPACLRTVTREVLLAAAGDAAGRVEREVAWSADGQGAPCSVVVWVDKVRSAELEQDWKKWRPLLSLDHPLEGADATLLLHAAEGSRLLVFDFLLDNWDRWSGSNTFRVGKDGPSVWLDNAAGFGHYGKQARARNAANLEGVERLSRSLVAALGRVDDARLAEALGPAGLRPITVRQLVLRRDLLRRRIEQLVARYGEARVLAFE